MHQVLDITKSLAYHGFKKIILLNGHGSNMPNLDLVARRTNLETDAECVPVSLVEPADGGQGVPAPLAAEQVPRRLLARLRAGDVAVPLPRRRQRPQGPDQERHHQLQRGGQPVQVGRPVRAPARRRSSRGRAATPRPACWATPSWRPPRRAGEAYEEAVKQLVRFVTWFKDRPKDVRRDLPPHGRRPCRSPGASGRSAAEVPGPIDSRAIQMTVGEGTEAPFSWWTFSVAALAPSIRPRTAALSRGTARAIRVAGKTTP